MEEFIGRLNEVLGPLQADERLGPVHICVYLALWQCSEGRVGWFGINRVKVMGMARIKGAQTYYRVLRELAGLGLIEYWASRNGKRASRVKFGKGKIKPVI